MMMQSNAYRATLVLAVVALLAGCAGGAGPIPDARMLQTAGGSAGAAASLAPDRRRVGKQKVAMRILVPRAPKHARGRQPRPYFVASSTQGVLADVYAHGGSTVLASTAVGLNGSNCTAVTGGRSCTIAFSAPVGNDDFVIASYDAQPVKGSFAAAKQLAVGKTTFTVVKDQANAIHLTLGGVVAKGTVELTTASVPAIDSNSQTVTVSAQDADGNTLIADGWFDTSDNAVTMSLDTTVGPAAASFFKFTPSTVSFAAPTSVMAYTSSGASPTQIQNGFTGVVWANPSNGGTSGATNLTVTKPSITEVSVTTGSSQPSGITVGPDNALWFTECETNKVGRITTGGSLSEFSTGISTNAAPKGIAAGPDGKLWFAESGLGKVASIDPTTDTVVEHVTPSGSSDTPTGIIEGPDGNMWFTESSATYSQIAKFSASALDGGVGLIVEYTAKTAGSAPNGIAAGPDNNIWFTESTIDQIGRITTSGTGATDFTLPTNSLGQGGITAGPDGAMWFAEQNPNMGNKIGSMTTAGSVTSQTTITSNAFSNPTGIVTGPDGALWFTENCNNSIGRIDPATKTIVEFSLPHATSYPYGIVEGPDGAMWFTEGLGNRIGKLQ